MKLALSVLLLLAPAAAVLRQNRCPCGTEFLEVDARTGACPPCESVSVEPEPEPIKYEGPPAKVDMKDSCTGISCAPLECKPPFEYMSDMGTCCPLCWAESVKAPEDRSWTKDLTGGVGANNNADPTLCRTVMCPPLICAEYDQEFDGRCCTKCKTSVETKSAADYRGEMNLLTVHRAQERKEGPMECVGVECAPLNCQPPFTWKSATDAGTCCPLCWSDEIVVPEDRSWAKDLTGGIGMDPNADPVACRNVVCLPPDCEAFDQAFDGRCCTKCKSSMDTKSAADYRGEMGLVQEQEGSQSMSLEEAEANLRAYFPNVYSN